MEYGLTNKGFKPKSFAEIKESYTQLLSQITDPKSGEKLKLDWDSNDIIVQLLNIVINNEAELWQLLANVYSQFNPNVATKESLTSLAQLNGIVRKNGKPSEVELQFIGTGKGIRIPAGTRVSDENKEVVWQTMTDLVTDEDGLAVGRANSLSNGIFDYKVGTINQLLDIPTGIQAVINITDTIGGEINESDRDLRRRRKQTLMISSKNTPESIYSAVSSLEGVEYVKVYVNSKLEVDEKYGLPPKTFCVVVQGGVQEEIASAIANRITPGIQSYGDVATAFVDSLGIETMIYFMRPIARDIMLSIDISSVDSSNFPDNYEKLIKDNIINYAREGSSALGINTQEGFDDYGFSVGKNVVVSKLYTPINAVPGLKINSVLMSYRDKVTDEWTQLSENDIEINWNEVAVFLVDNIKVNLT